MPKSLIRWAIAKFRWAASGRATTLGRADDNLLVIAGLGSSNWDITAAGDRPLNMPLWGSMGAPVGMGLGLALAQPTKRVLVITGDGDMLMSLGSLATVATQMPENLAIVVLDNEKFGETGNQATHTSPRNNGPTDSGAGTDLAAWDRLVAEFGAADQGAAHFGHGQDFTRVVRLDRAAVQDRRGGAQRSHCRIGPAPPNWPPRLRAR